MDVARALFSKIFPGVNSRCNRRLTTPYQSPITFPEWRQLLSLHYYNLVNVFHLKIEYSTHLVIKQWTIISLTCEWWMRILCCRRGLKDWLRIRHAPVHRPLFIIVLLSNAPLHHNFTPNDPLFCLFNHNFLQNHQILEKRVIIACSLCSFTPNEPVFRSVPITSFCKKIVTDGPFIWCIGTRHVTFVCECSPQTGCSFSEHNL